MRPGGARGGGGKPKELTVVEYSELPPAMAAAADEKTGELLFSAWGGFPRFSSSSAAAVSAILLRCARFSRPFGGGPPNAGGSDARPRASYAMTRVSPGSPYLAPTPPADAANVAQHFFTVLFLKRCCAEGVQGRRATQCSLWRRSRLRPP